MAAIDDLYPPAPAAVPADLTTPTRAYRFRVVVVLLCLLVFVGVYVSLTVGSAYACYACFAALGDDEPRPAPPTRDVNGRYTPPPPRPPRREKPVFWLVVGGITSGLVFLFMVKGLFKRSRAESGVRVEVTERDQPVLFAFIRRLCAEIGAPFPHRVYLVPDVNAAVSFHESFLNLIFPSRKNLIIGLALVNRLNLSEFKAVLAHEFGHFSQGSMKLGSYVYTANRVVADVVYRRDWLDDLLATLRRIDIRIAVFAWGFSAILWVMRKGLEKLFRLINFAHVALSRQMEYNADLVAVRAAGSDALIFALARLDFASDALAQAWNDLTAAADHGRYTRDLYYHHTKAAEYLRARRNDAKLGEVPPLPDDFMQSVEVFKSEDTSVPTMWATHPSNYDREANVKRRYVRSPMDDRSAWELFDNADAVREEVTRQVYESARKAFPGTLEEPEAVQAFIDAEHAETTYNPRYHGLYDNRYLKPGDLAELCARPAREAFDDPAELASAHARLYETELAERMAANKVRNEELGKLAQLAHGAVQLTGSDFEHRGRRHRLADAPKLLKTVEEELDRDFDWMHEVDRKVFRVHYAMAARLGGTAASELERWYQFHFAVQELHALLTAHVRHVQATLAALGGERQVSPEAFQNALSSLREAHDTLVNALEQADELKLPPLTNMTPGAPLGPYLMSDKLVRNLSAGTTSLDGSWIQQFLNQVGEVIDKSARVLFKSLGGLLLLQERIAEQWASRQTLTPGEGEPPAPDTVSQ